MPIQYALRENHLTADTNNYYAKVQAQRTLELDEIIERMLGRGSTLTKEDLLAATQAFHQTIIQCLSEGYNVVTPTANYRVSIRGIFDNPGDGFDSSRHAVQPAVAAGKVLRQALSQVGVTKVEANVITPNPVELFDFASQTANELLTPGSGGRLIGHRLKFEADDPEQGLFFIAADGTATRAEMVMTNKAAELVFIIPLLAAGDYTIEVRALFGQTVRTGNLPAQSFTVTA